MTEPVKRVRGSRTLLAVLAGAALLALHNGEAAQGMAVMPLKGQSAQQAEADKQQCYSTAVQTSGYDPSGAQGTKQPAGGRVKGAAVGAAAGAAAAEARGRQHEAYDRIDDDVKQEYRRQDAKSAAAAGAVVGGAAQRRDRRQSSAQAAQGAQAFDSAYRSCLTARGYSVQ